MYTRDVSFGKLTPRGGEHAKKKRTIVFGFFLESNVLGIFSVYLKFWMARVDSKSSKEKWALTYEINRPNMYCILKWPKSHQQIKWKIVWPETIEIADMRSMLLVYWSYVYGRYVWRKNIFFIFIAINSKGSSLHQKWFGHPVYPFSFSIPLKRDIHRMWMPINWHSLWVTGMSPNGTGFHQSRRSCNETPASFQSAQLSIEWNNKRAKTNRISIK